MKKNILILCSIILLSLGQCFAITIEEIQDLENSINAALTNLNTLQKKYSDDGGVAYLDEARKPAEKLAFYLDRLTQGYSSLPKQAKEKTAVEQKIDTVFIKTAIALEENFTGRFKSAIEKIIPDRSFDPRYYSEKVKKLSSSIRSAMSALSKIHESFKASQDPQQQEKELAKIPRFIDTVKKKLTALFDYLLALTLVPQESKATLNELVKSDLTASLNVLATFEDDAFKKEVISQMRQLFTELEQSPFLQTEEAEKNLSEIVDAFEELEDVYIQSTAEELIRESSDELLADFMALENIYEDFKTSKDVQAQKNILAKISSVMEDVKTKSAALFDNLLALPSIPQENKNKIIESVTSDVNTSFNVVKSFEDNAFKKEVISQLKPVVTDLEQSPFMQIADANKFQDIFDAFAGLYIQPDLSVAEPSEPVKKELSPLLEITKDISGKAIADIKILSDLDLKFRQAPTGSLEEQNTLDEMKKLVKDSIAPNLDITFKTMLSIADLPDKDETDKDEIIASSQLIPDALLAFFRKAGTPEFKIEVIKELIPILKELKNAPVMKTPEGETFQDFFDQFDGMLYTEIAEEQMAQEAKAPQMNIPKKVPPIPKKVPQTPKQAPPIPKKVPQTPKQAPPIPKKVPQMNISDLIDHLNGLYVNLTALRTVL